MNAAALALMALVASRAAWVSKHSVETPKELGIGVGGAAPGAAAYAEEPACAPPASIAKPFVLHAVALSGKARNAGVVCVVRDEAQEGHVLAKAGSWYRPLNGRAHRLVALAHERVAVLLEDKLLIVDGTSGRDIGALPLEWADWAAADGDGVLVRSRNALLAVDVEQGGLVVRWRAPPTERQDKGGPVKCGARWVDVAVLRDFPDGEYASARATITMRTIDHARGVIDTRQVAVEPGFFDLVSFATRCDAKGRVDIEGHWIILD